MDWSALVSGCAPLSTPTILKRSWARTKDCQSNFLVAPVEPLTSVVCHVTSRPIWATMATLLSHLESSRLESLCIWHMVTTHDSTHVGGGGGEIWGEVV